MHESLTLTPIGVGAAYARPGEAQSSYLVRAADRAICLDLGAGALNVLQTVCLPEDLDAIVITHLHPDHCADLLALRVYMWIGPGRGRRIRVLGPAALRERLTDFAGDGGWDDAFSFETLDGERGTRDLGGGLELRYAQVPHIAPTFAIRVDWRGSSVCYGADCAPNDTLVELASGCNLLVAECSNGPGPSASDTIHLSALDAGEIARRAKVERLLLTHCYPENDRDATLRAAEACFEGRVAWARQSEGVVASSS